MHLILYLLLLQAAPALQQSPNSPAQRQREHARHHDTVVPHKPLPDSTYAPISPKPTAAQIKALEATGHFVHCWNWALDFCMVETPKTAKPPTP